MDSTRLRDIGRLEILARGVAPAFALGYARRAGDDFEVVSAAGGVAAPSREVSCRRTTRFDLASLTKPLVAAVTARLWAHGVLSPRASLGSLLDEARHTPSADVPLEHFLSHRAGLRAHVELFEPLTRGAAVDRSEALARAASERRADCRGAPPDRGFAPVYSDLGYILVGAALERLAGAPLDALLEAEIARPLRLEIASARIWTERDPEFESDVAETETVAYRGGPVIGTVHDDNAWALSGPGLSGHAGAFGTAEAVARFGCAILQSLGGRRADFLPRWAAHWLVRPRPGGSQRAGFDAKARGASMAGQLVGPRTFGHLGFTGTSVWCDPDAQIVTVILTNRVCPRRDHWAIRAARPRISDSLFLEATRPRPARLGRRRGPDPGVFGKRTHNQGVLRTTLGVSRDFGQDETRRCGS